MRLCIGFLIVCVACKKADSPATKGSAGSGSAPVVTSDAAPAVALADAAPAPDAAAAGPPLPAFCIDGDDVDGQLRVVTNSAAGFTFCFHLHEGMSVVTDKEVPERDKCAMLDLVTGKLEAVAPPPKAPEPKPTAKRDASKLELPEDHEWATAISPDGKTIAATSDIAGQLFLVDATSGKVKKVVKWSADGGCMEPPSFIGDNIYVQYNVCAGPGATGWIVSPDGKKLGSLKHVNPTGDYFAVGGGRYAFEDFGGSGVEFVDGKTGKSIKEVEIKGCEDCPTFSPFGLGLEQLPNGKLIQFTSPIAIIDPASMTIEKTVMWPTCSKQGK